MQVRMVRPAGKQRLRDGFRRVSATSRYRRFLAHRKGITPEELRFFTQVDGEGHFALVALELNDLGQEEDAIGVARLLRVEEDTAEFPLALTDDRQRGGVGRHGIGTTPRRGNGEPVRETWTTLRARMCRPL